MNFLPKASGTRPRVACDISAHGVVAARADAAGAPVSAAARVELAAGAVTPSLKPGNVVDRVAVVAGLRKTLESVGLKANSRDADVSLVIPDGAVRVSLLEFDSLPTKLTEALPLVRFRLKKMMPFDADDAMVTFQVMSTSKTMVRVLAVAIPRDVLSEYESVVREAGYEPGAVLPSTLASLAATDSEPALVVNANTLGVTSAIVRGGIVLLHRSMDLQMPAEGTPANVPPAMFETPGESGDGMLLPLVDVHETAGEWAAQEPLPEHGRNPYADRAADEAAVQNEDGVTGMPEPRLAAVAETGRKREPGDPAYSPYASPTLTADLSAELHDAILVAPTSLGTLAEEDAAAEVAAAALHTETPRHAATLPMLSEEISQAVSVAVAYFEDTLATAPETILAAGPMGAAELTRILGASGVAQVADVRVQELVSSESLLSGATGVPRGWLAGVTGALRG